MTQSNQTAKTLPVPHPSPIAVRPEDFARRIGVSRRYLYNLLKHPDPARRLPKPFKIGRATFWKLSDVQDWVDRQAQNTAA